MSQNADPSLSPHSLRSLPTIPKRNLSLNPHSAPIPPIPGKTTDDIQEHSDEEHSVSHKSTLDLQKSASASSIVPERSIASLVSKFSQSSSPQPSQAPASSPNANRSLPSKPPQKKSHLQNSGLNSSLNSSGDSFKKDDKSDSENEEKRDLTLKNHKSSSAYMITPKGSASAIDQQISSRHERSLSSDDTVPPKPSLNPIEAKKPLPPPPPGSPRVPPQNQSSLSQSGSFITSPRSTTNEFSNARKIVATISPKPPMSPTLSVSSPTLTTPTSLSTSPSQNSFFLPKGPATCAKCEKPFELNEAKMSAKGKLWHKHCFVCSSCNQTFTESYATIDNKPYHLKCLCAQCRKPFPSNEPKMSAQGLLWHKTCFVCTHCKNPFTQTFTTKNNRVYHVECWLDVCEKQKQQQQKEDEEDQPSSLKSSSSFHFAPDIHMITSLKSYAKEKYGYLKDVANSPKKARSGGSSINFDEKKDNMKEDARKLKKEEKEKKNQLKKEKKLEEQKKKQEIRRKEAEERDKERLLQSKKKIRSYNGMMVRAQVDQNALGMSAESLVDNGGKPLDFGNLAFKIDDIFHITDGRQLSNEKAVASGGTAVVVCYHDGLQGYVPMNCLELIEASHEEEQKVLFKRLLELLVSPDMFISLALCSIAPREDHTLLAKTFASLFEANGNIMEFIHILIQNEIAQTSDAATLFRTNSIASAIMTYYFFNIGRDYLKSILRPLVLSTANLVHSVEVDPSKDENATENIPHLIEIGQKFLDAILESLDECPKPIKNICFMLASEVETKFPTAKHIVIGGFFFLRALTPAVVSPENFEIASDLNPKSRRVLLLVSKLLQNVSNAREFKEDYMKPINPFINHNAEIAKVFFDELSKEYFDDALQPVKKDLMQSIDNETLLKLHYQIGMNICKIGKETVMMDDFIQLDYSPFESLLPIMHELGPSTLLKPEASSPVPHQREAQKRQKNLFLSTIKDFSSDAMKIFANSESDESKPNKSKIETSSPRQEISKSEVVHPSGNSDENHAKATDLNS